MSPDMSNWTEIPGKAQEILERLHLSADLGALWNPPEELKEAEEKENLEKKRLNEAENTAAFLGKPKDFP